jgi:hypothetical protein
MHNLTVERTAPDQLTTERWVFWYDNRYHALRPSSYVRATRPTLRHKFRNEVTWEQHRRRDNGALVLPDDVQAEAIAQFQAGITVKPWEDK